MPNGGVEYHRKMKKTKNQMMTFMAKKLTNFWKTSVVLAGALFNNCVEPSAGVMVLGRLEKVGVGMGVERGTDLTREFEFKVAFNNTNDWVTILRPSGRTKPAWESTDKIVTWIRNQDVHETKLNNTEDVAPTDNLHSGRHPIRGAGHSLHLWLALILPHSTNLDEVGVRFKLPAPWSDTGRNRAELALCTVAKANENAVDLAFWDSGFENCVPGAEKAHPRALLRLEKFGAINGYQGPKMANLILYKHAPRLNGFSDERQGYFKIAVDRVEKENLAKLTPTLETIRPVVVNDYRIQDALKNSKYISYVISNKWLGTNDPELKSILNAHLKSSPNRREGGGLLARNVTIGMIVALLGFPVLLYWWVRPGKRKV